MPLYLGADHEIVLSDGSLNRLGDLVGKEDISGIGWLVNGFREQPISVHNAADADVQLWKLISLKGRELTCANDTHLLGTGGKWKVFHHDTDRKRNGGYPEYFLPVKAVNYLPVFGTATVDSIWIKWLITTLLQMSKTDKKFIAIPTFLATLDSSSLHRCLHAISKAFPSKLLKSHLFIHHIDYVDQQRLFHLFDRTIYAPCVPKKFCKVADQKAKCKNHRINWASRTATSEKHTLWKWDVSKSTEPIRKDKIKLYRLIDDTPVRIESKFGNVVEKNFICKTK